MENDDTTKDQGKTPAELPPSAAKKQTCKERSKAQHASKKADENKKKSYRRSWRSTSPIRKIEIILAAVVAAGAIGYLGVTIWGTLQTRWNFQLERRPRISVTKFQIMDALKGPPKANQHELKIGEPLVVNINFKNTGMSPAVNSVFHYHLLFGNGVHDFMIEPSDKGRTGNTIDQGEERTVTAVSIKNTYSRESVDLNLATVVNWDGSEPVLLFGRASYEDSDGTFYCSPYMATWITGSWAFESSISVDGKKFMVGDLCPKD